MTELTKIFPVLPSLDLCVMKSMMGGINERNAKADLLAGQFHAVLARVPIYNRNADLSCRRCEPENPDGVSNRFVLSTTSRYQEGGQEEDLLSVTFHPSGDVVFERGKNVHRERLAIDAMDGDSLAQVFCALTTFSKDHGEPILEIMPRIKGEMEKMRLQMEANKHKPRC